MELNPRIHQGCSKKKHLETIKPQTIDFKKNILEGQTDETKRDISFYEHKIMLPSRKWKEQEKGEERTLNERGELIKISITWEE